MNKVGTNQILGLGTVKKWSFLRGEIENSKRSQTKRMHTLCKDFNIKQNNAQAWLMYEEYNYEQEPFSLEDFRGSFCLGAVDLSATTDMCNAKILLMKPNDKKKYIYTHYWILEKKLTDSDDIAAGAKYQEWARKGLLTIHDGNEIDITKIADWFYQLYKDYNIKSYITGFDQRFSKAFTDRMNDFSFEIEMILQGKVLSNAMKYVEADLKDRLINYNNNEVDKWCLGNSAVEMDNLGNIMCVKVKKQASKRIDGAITLIILYELYRRYRSEFHKLIDKE